MDAPVVVGVLALQGGFAAHATVLRELGAEVREVRTPADLEGFLAMLPATDETSILLAFRDWVRALPPRQPSPPPTARCS